MRLSKRESAALHRVKQEQTLNGKIYYIVKGLGMSASHVFLLSTKCDM
jgi:hypothetical protein